MKKIILLMFLVLNVLVMAGEKLKIGITLLPYYSFVANIVKDRAEVIPIVKAEGFDSHTYQPKVEDIERASKVDAIVVNGVGHDEFVYKIIDAVDKKNKPVIINANKDVSLMPVAGTLGNEKIMDSHTFISITAAIQQVHNITKEIIKLDPKNKDFYEANLKTYLEKLSKLDKESKDKFNNIPAEKKMIVTSEGAFKYFSKAYNVPSAYIWEINTEEEGTPDQIKTLVEKLRKTKVPSLFVESSVDERPMQTVSKDTNIPIYEKIFTDSIAEPGQNGDSYYSMMKWNLDKISEGLAK